MSYLTRILTAAGALLRAAAAGFVKAFWAVVAFFQKVNDTYRGYLNIPELVTIGLVTYASGGGAEAIVRAIAAHTGTILVNVDPAQVGQYTQLLVALAGVLHRLGSGQKVPTPSARNDCPRTMR